MTTSFTSPDAAPLRRRVASFALAAGANLILLALLLGLVPNLPGPPPADRGPITFQLSREAEQQEATQQARTKAKRGGEEAPRTEAPRAAAPSPAPAPPVAPEPDRPLPMILLTPQQFAAADIGRMPRRAGPRADEAGAPEAAAGGGGSDGSIGVGPRGERLYKAEWYREPTQAELSTYMPESAPRIGWGLVACRTVPGNRVEDCVEMGESPQGSGLARAVRRAAWQFKVRPPRIGGRPMVGAWVQIRIDYSERPAE